MAGSSLVVATDTECNRRAVTGSDQYGQQATDLSAKQVRCAIKQSRNYILKIQQDGHWATAVYYEHKSQPTNVMLTINYALTLELYDAKPKSQRQAIQYILSTRSRNGGWNNTVANYGALLLLRKTNATRYQAVIKDIRREIKQQDMEFVFNESNKSTHLFSQGI